MAKAQKKLSPQEKKKRDRESLIETLESIIVAFMLAFIFRAFVVEAFVIPTGSMANELNGLHRAVRCPDCGYEFNFSANGGPNSAAVCQNCFRTISPREMDSPTFSGDRILVLKFIYNFSQPSRWDVVVFKNPNKPLENENYIKRLVGRPGEKIAIYRGDVYIDDKIAVKPDKTQDALWLLVHDTNYRPTRPGWIPRWETSAGAEEVSRGFDLSPTGNDAATLSYWHRNAYALLRNIHNFNAYVSKGNGPAVTDLSLRAWVKLDRPTAVLRLVLSAYKDTFEFTLAGPEAGDKAQILINGTPRATNDKLALPIGEQFQIEVVNVDHKLVLRLNGRRLFDLDGNGTVDENDDLTYEPTEMSRAEQTQFEPPEKSASVVRLEVAGSSAHVSRLVLLKDVYYTDADFNPPDCDLRERPGYKHSGDSGWATRGQAVSLQEDEFFMLGDNSPHSLDSRLWWNRGPRSFAVPRKNLIGKAFFVYWPAAGKRYGLPFLPDATAWRMVH